MRAKRKLISVAAALLAVITLTHGASAAFSETLLDGADYTLTNGNFIYNEATVQENGQQKIFYGEYNATTDDAEYEWVIHSIRNGSDTTLSTVLDIAKDYEEQTGRKVMFASNGDYFYTAGNNVESYVNDGIVISKGAFTYKHCIGFDNEGKVTIGRMTEVEKRLMLVLDDERIFFEIDAYNEDPGENGIAIYTTPGTYTIENAGKYICRSSGSNLTNYPVWGSSNRMTEGEVVNNDSFTLKSGQFAIVVRGDNAQYLYDNIKYGVEVDLVEIPGGEFEGCTWVVGGYDILVNEGVVNTEPHTDNDGSGNAPRTMIGVKEDGTFFLCMVDGRQSGYSVGISVAKEAQLAKALGAVYALELDGGGSTTVIVRIDDELTLRNQPSDGSMRRVSNAVLLVEKEKEAEDAGSEEPDVEPTPPATEPEATTTEPVATTTESTQQPAEQPSNGARWGLVIGAVAAIVVIAVPVVGLIIFKKREH